MSRRKNKISGQFSVHLVKMLESPAHRTLSLSARRLLDRIEIEHAHHGGQDNGKLPVTFNQFHEYGIHRHSIAPATREAEALGFLVVTVRGRAGNAEHRAPNLFRLTYRHADGIPGDGTHEWQRITTISEAEAIADAARNDKPAKKTKSQCRKMPVTGDENHHRNIKIPVPETITTEVAKTITTSISRDIPPIQPACEARPPKGAVASKQAATSTMLLERQDILHNRLAKRLGRNGWEIMMDLQHGHLHNLIILEDRGELTEAVLADIRRQHQARGAA